MFLKHFVKLDGRITTIANHFGHFIALEPFTEKFAGVLHAFFKVKLIKPFAVDFLKKTAELTGRYF